MVGGDSGFGRRLWTALPALAPVTRGSCLERYEWKHYSYKGANNEHGTCRRHADAVFGQQG